MSDNILKDARKKLKLTQKQAAEKLGLAQGHYCNYENKMYTPRIQVMNNFAEVLKIPRKKVYDFYTD